MTRFVEISKHNYESGLVSKETVMLYKCRVKHKNLILKEFNKGKATTAKRFQTEADVSTVLKTLPYNNCLMAVQYVLFELYTNLLDTKVL